MHIRFIFVPMIHLSNDNSKARENKRFKNKKTDQSRNGKESEFSRILDLFKIIDQWDVLSWERFEEGNSWVESGNRTDGPQVKSFSASYTTHENRSEQNERFESIVFQSRLTNSSLLVAKSMVDSTAVSWSRRQDEKNSDLRGLAELVHEDGRIFESAVASGATVTWNILNLAAGQCSSFFLCCEKDVLCRLTRVRAD